MDLEAEIYSGSYRRNITPDDVATGKTVLRTIEDAHNQTHTYSAIEDWQNTTYIWYSGYSTSEA